MCTHIYVIHVGCGSRAIVSTYAGVTLIHFSAINFVVIFFYLSWIIRESED